MKITVIIGQPEIESMIRDYFKQKKVVVKPNTLEVKYDHQGQHDDRKVVGFHYEAEVETEPTKEK